MDARTSEYERATVAVASSDDLGIERNIDNQRVFLNRSEILRQDKRFWFFRRLQDILFSILAIAVLWPAVLIVAIAIYIDSPGASPFFIQKRVGRDGVIFPFIKLRSMVPQAEEKLHTVLDQNEMTGPVFKIKHDPRITRIGKFIRKTSIDELPQLINVLKGDMSIVGPRPALPREVAQYDDYQLQRLYVTPGLTCYWQTQNNRNSLSFDEWLELDLKYIRERSFWVDWKIIGRTFGAVLGLQGE
ncbi:MAG: sugar transferase [Clostridiales bacterium]|nr:sugar transferase [Clostridiales bacterium]